MKTFKKSLVLLIALVSSLVATATDIETVHLKNGNAIHGIIIEQVPGTSIKIQTTDGNILSYDMSEVEKITREKAPTTKFSSSNPGGTQVGYRGFIDLNYTIGVGDFSIDRMGVSTTHGYQFCPYFFLGAGVGVDYFSKNEAFSVPFFADLRTDILNNTITPFIDFKIGYSVGDARSLYMSPSIGCRFGCGKNSAVLISIGYTYLKPIVTVEYKSYNAETGMWQNATISGREICGGITIKAGIEF